MAIAPTEIDVDHHHLACVWIDEQLLHFAEIAPANGAHLPATNVGLTLGDVPAPEILQSNQPLRVACVRSNAGRVALPVAIDVRHATASCVVKVSLLARTRAPAPMPSRSPSPIAGSRNTTRQRRR